MFNNITFFQEWDGLDIFEESNENNEETGNRVRGDRNWGLPSFKDQIDGGVTYFDLVIEKHLNDPFVIRSHLEFRKNSTGSDIWDCTLVLAHFFAIHSTIIEGSVVVELGSGVGALGMMIFKLGASKVILTDLEPNCDLIRRNIKQNFFSLTELYDDDHGIEVKTLEWGNTHFDNFFSMTISSDESDKRKRLVIVGSDLFLPFAPHLLRPLCETISALLQFSSPNINPSSPFQSAEVYIAYEERFDCSPFYMHANDLNIAIENISNDELNPHYQDPGIIFVLRLTLKDAYYL